MPPGAAMEPLALFRSLAKNEELMDAMKVLGSYFLGGRSPLPLRLREMLILRTCANAGCEYEWGVHVSAFSKAADLSCSDIKSLTPGTTSAPRWSDAEQCALDACDELSTSTTLSENTREGLKGFYNEAEILTIITLVSWYRVISGLANSVCDSFEPWAARFPSLT
ncbi:carboxymuconolactone decarboxylase family protein [Kordiimonas aestuarii]|uniref:carboxymuconolactone decarboxylase family protein n=1 Tax=Kordiimonas aestuarii TaxID=1005925 RepID=UPI0021D1A8D0|nr:carboxymuconolactone decarboxylase family protein [Kordiimonas aestuarii]